jgi:hypothetical protein
MRHRPAAWAGLSDEQAHLPESRWRAAPAPAASSIAPTGSNAGPHRRGRPARALLPDRVAAAFPDLAPAAGPPPLLREAWLVGHPEEAGAPHIRAGADWLAGLFAASA